VDRRAGGQEHVRCVLFRHQLQEIADVHVPIPNETPGPLRIRRRLPTMAAHPEMPRPPNGVKLRTLQDRTAGIGLGMRARAHGLRLAAAAHRRHQCRPAGAGARVRRRRRAVRSRRTCACAKPACPGPVGAGRAERVRGPRPGPARDRPGRGGPCAQPRGRGHGRTRAAPRPDRRTAPEPRHGGRPMTARAVTALLFMLVLLAAPQARAADDSEAALLDQRLVAIDADASANGLAPLERLQARQAVQALATARARQRPGALRVAQWRVETAEIATRTAVARREIDRLERERTDLLLEASRREAARARQEAERLRGQTQIQAEEAARLREAAEAESMARQEAETVLQGVSSREAARLRAARQRAAELKRQEEELMRSLESTEGSDPR